jgi:hypothetical protein
MARGSAARLPLAALLLAALLPAPGLAESRFVQLIAPDLARLQVGGGQGMISGGFGYRFWGNRVQAEALYGYAPTSMVGTELHALSQKTSLAPFIFRPAKDVRLAPLLGYSANVAIGENYFLVLPDRYQDYYWPSALRFWIFTGLRAEAISPWRGPVRSVSGIAEVGAHDIYLQAWHGNEMMEAADVFSLSLALQLRFRAG